MLRRRLTIECIQDVIHHHVNLTLFQLIPASQPSLLGHKTVDAHGLGQEFIIPVQNREGLVWHCCEIMYIISGFRFETSWYY